MKSNLTLSADESLIRKARAAAKVQGRSLNDLIREHLQRIAGDAHDELPSLRFRQLLSSVEVDETCVENWQREDAYERIG